MYAHTCSNSKLAFLSLSILVESIFVVFGMRAPLDTNHNSSEAWYTNTNSNDADVLTSLFLQLVFNDMRSSPACNQTTQLWLGTSGAQTEFIFILSYWITEFMVAESDSLHLPTYLQLSCFTHITTLE